MCGLIITFTTIKLQKAGTFSLSCSKYISVWHIVKMYLLNECVSDSTDEFIVAFPYGGAPSFTTT